MGQWPSLLSANRNATGYAVVIPTQEAKHVTSKQPEVPSCEGKQQCFQKAEGKQVDLELQQVAQEVEVSSLHHA